MRLRTSGALTLSLAAAFFLTGSAANATEVEGQKCITCHAEKQPGIVTDWKNSRHSEEGVSCIDCHSVDADSPLASQACPGVKGTATYITVAVTPNVCANCHSEQVEQFNASGHYRASLQYHAEDGRNYKSMKALMETHEGQGIEKFKNAADMTGCMQCHGSVVTLGADNRPNKEGWPAAGIGTIYPDGSVGNCVVCHTRHRFNLAEARKPAACASCHLGPDHPDIEVYNNSKHGHIYNSEGGEWNYSSPTASWEPGDYRAPTCAVCHQSGIGELESTHNISERLKWNLWAKRSNIRNSSDPLSMLTGDGEKGRALMKQVCSNCHTKTHTDNFFEQTDNHIELYNEGYFDVADKMLKELKEKGLVKKNPWDDEFQKIYYHLWHHQGRRMRHGAAMGGPDYAHWHGVFELQQDLYELKHIYKQRMAAGKIE
ncbi:multiheme c-type cytochrome [Desulfogranum japonicum]|uniref:multiheme c-type cytochrome n=1 Tax=Desulfogranum japonicum TaxID=231447 RepID=UPI00048FDEC3|nr:multiheme c-type cytochrome [Desulfogranum japonicum]